jgi:hypothetical protein
MITIIVAARVLYGFWRSWHAWSNATSGTGWLIASGAAGSIGVGRLCLVTTLLTGPAWLGA